MPERTTSYKKTSLPTQERILDAAEILFVEKGFTATSMRAIADLAEVNLAATNYHFNSKEGLLAATFHRQVDPINQIRLSNLNRLETDSTPGLAAIVKAFLEPLVDDRLSGKLPRLIARIYAEPAAITRPLIEREFSEVQARYLQALSRVLDVDEQELQWRFHFFIGAMLHTLNFPVPVRMHEPGNRSEAITRLQAFVIAGLTQDNGRINLECIS